MFAVIYRWKIKLGREQEFSAAWKVRTGEIAANHRGLGSRLHRGDDGTWIAYAQWPSRECWDDFGKRSISSEAAQVVKSCTETVETLFAMDVVEDLLGR